VLRIILSYYLSIPAADIHFSYGERGKPSLISSGLDLRFNSSHSGDIAIYSIACRCELGIDVEHIRSLPDMEQIAHRFFCTEEITDLLAAPAGERETAFFRCWTRKEAYIKAIGDGLAVPLDSFRVSLRSDDQIRIIGIYGDPDAAKAWNLHELVPADGFIGALAYRDSRRPVRVHPLMSLDGFLNLPWISYGKP